MPTTRKKVIKTVYKDADSEDETGDFSDSGSEAHISEPPSSDEEEIEEAKSSADEFNKKSFKKRQKQPVKRKQFAKELVGKINKHQTVHAECEESEFLQSQFSVKDLTDADKLLPPLLNLSESDSSDDETPKASVKKTPAAISYSIQESDTDDEKKDKYTDVWSNSIHDNSAEIAKKTFMELEQHKTTIEETKASLQSYVSKTSVVQHNKESNVTDLLALGEEVDAQKKSPVKKKTRSKKVRNDSDSELEDWEEVKESKGIPQQGIQLTVALPDSVCRKSKTIDVEMMMKRKINRVKKEHQVFMHKVHVLCWIGHGNFVSRVLNDQEIMAAVLAMVPKGCYPEARLNMKYVEQITSWFKDKFTQKQDKYENKFRPKAPPLKNILLEQIKMRTVTAKKYSVFIFVAMLRALGLQCRIMFNFVTLPLKPPSTELCSLSVKPKDQKSNEGKSKANKKSSKTSNKAVSSKSNENIAQVDGIDDSYLNSDSEFENIMQLDGSDDVPTTKTRSIRSSRAKKASANNVNNAKDEEGVSPPKRLKKETEPTAETSLKPNTRNKLESPGNKQDSSKSPQRPKSNKNEEDNSIKKSNTNNNEQLHTLKSPKSLTLKKSTNVSNLEIENNIVTEKSPSPRKTRNNVNNIIVQNNKPRAKKPSKSTASSQIENKHIMDLPKIKVTDEDQKTSESKYFENIETAKGQSTTRSTRKRSHTAVVNETKQPNEKQKATAIKTRTKSVPGHAIEKSKYFDNSESEKEIKKPKLTVQQLKKQEKLEDAQRVSHKDLTKTKRKPKNDVTVELVNIIKGRIKNAKEEGKKGIVKGKMKIEDSDDDSDFLPVEDPKIRDSESDEDFKPVKISPRAPKLSPGARPSTSKKIDRRVLSTDDESMKDKKVDIWCEIFVEELEQWISVDVIKGKVHCTGELYSHATHPVCYVIGWDNNNYLKDLTRRYVPHWNTVTRKQRAEPEWWNSAVQPWLGPKNARDKEEDEALDRMQLEAPLPKSIAEYKNHPLYALKRHLLKFEALYPPDAATLGFVRNEAVYARECVHTCRSRDTWLKEAKVVKLGEQPYKVVKARPKWDKLSNKLITDKPLEVFGPWQVQDYEPPTAENGVVPRNAYGNVELFKDCMLPKGTVHIKLPGLNKVARKLNIDCAPAMTGFDFNGGWSHPVYDGFVVCKEFEEIVTQAWVEDQEEQERKELEKIELRVYGNWKRLIKGLLIRERLKHKYGFEKPSTSQTAKNKGKGPRLVVKKNS